MHKLFSIEVDGSFVRLALTPGQTNCYLAYTADILKGDITVYDLITCTKQISINAHTKPLIQMTFNQKGNLLATASANVSVALLIKKQGKIIRVFSIPSGTKMYALNRGIHTTEIYSLSFDADSTLLGLTSVRGTLHIFELSKSKHEALPSKDPYHSPLFFC